MLAVTASDDYTSTPAVPAPALFDLAGKTVLITGATRGIGAACAKALAQSGATICLAVRPPPQDQPIEPPSFISHSLREIHASLQNPSSPAPDVHVLPCDLGSSEDVKALVPAALARMGSIDILVNCAGIQRRAKAEEFSEQDWDDVIQTNLKSIFLLSQAAARHMLPRHSGKIINFCSLLTFQGGLTVPAYAAAKGALGQLTKAFSNEWAKEGIQVNAICPGYIATDMNEALLKNPTRLRQISERIPAGRWGTPEDFAGPVVFLASKASMYVNGELLVVDGGWMGR
ncbi:NAD(P)-binding protein [Sistotremastrum niveocremeum HHB9708]|uniref:NAD(P)-binding protein n=2 Tax=Sistotremastraceae TaxID=3402574 RepID=A0A164XWB3_9AGAM|nr:NAD(P)-binding protein [Sistotremastrum niveocremeum HHB9708]KZT36169.1 NAD(P)-binding protein [Sistotremastrum suecicum HHB10207 ss-3]